MLLTRNFGGLRAFRVPDNRTDSTVTSVDAVLEATAGDEKTDEQAA